MNAPLTTDFRPPWYLRSGHLQTVLTALPKPRIEFDNTIRYEVPIRDCGSSYVYWDVPRRRDPNAVPVFLLHGLGSSHSGPYMTGIARELLNRGVPVLRFDLPGSGPSLDLTWLPAHAGCDHEVKEMLVTISERLGISTWRGIGFSLGGNILLRMLAMQSQETSLHPSLIQRALAVAPPIELDVCSDGMSRGWNKAYANHFLKKLARESERRALHWKEWSSISQLPLPRTIREFDDRFTAVLAGYGTAKNYYALASAKPLLPMIDTPTTLLCDRHDPIVPPGIFSGITNPQIEIAWTRRGGHLGYLHRQLREGNSSLERWADRWIVNCILQSEQFCR